MMLKMNFKVIDKNTGKEADISEIALKEDWAKGLIYCDMEGFAINEDGQLILLDECGNFVYCPSERFTILYENAVVLTKEESALIDHNIKHLETVCNNLEKERNAFEQARKQTAKEIIEEIKSLLYPEEGGLLAWLVAIADKYGVEVEE